jgi:hypothetical protein
VYFLPLKFIVVPNLEQGAPGLGVGAATAVAPAIIKDIKQIGGISMEETIQFLILKNNDVFEE